MPPARKPTPPLDTPAVSEMPVAQLASTPAPTSALSPVPAGVLPRRPLPPPPELSHVDESELVLAFNRFLGPAQELPEAQIKPLRGNPLHIYRNVVVGTSAVLMHEPGLRAALPEVEWRTLHELPQLALALSFAASQVGKKARRPVAPLLARATKLRRLMLAAADMLVLAEQMPAHEVEKLRKGSSLPEVANDCLELAALFRRYEPARRRTVLTPEDLTDAQALGEELLDRQPRQSRAGKERRPRPATAGPSVELRDRLWTLLCNRHCELRRIGMWLFMDDVHLHVPALLAHTGGSAAPKVSKAKK